MSTHANKEVVRKFVDDVVNGEHPERAADYAAPEFLLHFPGEVGASNERTCRSSSPS